MIEYCLTLKEQYFSYIENENMFTTNKSFMLEGCTRMGISMDGHFDCRK